MHLNVCNLNFNMKKLLQLVSVLCLISFALRGQADDLVDTMRLAQRNDPEFKAAASTRDSTLEAYPQARSGMLPLINITGRSSRMRITNSAGNIISLGGTRVAGSNDYTLRLEQPLINFTNWMQLFEARATVKQAIATYNAAVQDLIIRVASAYFAVLEAQDNVRFTAAEKEANEQQLLQAKQRFEVGLDAITSVHDAQASYDNVVARLISTKNEVQNSLERLKQITGVRHEKLAPLKTTIPLVRPKPNNSDQWIKMSTQKNYDLIAARFAAQAARENIKINYSGHFPIVNLFADYRENHTGNVTGSGNLDQRIETIGIEVNVPIYQGGLVVSQTRQARYDYLTAINNLDEAYKATVSNTRQFFNNVVSGIGIIKAAKQAIISAESSLESNRAAFKVGTRTILDVLNRQRDLYDTQRVLAAEQYRYIINILELKRAAGTLNIADLEEINSWLKTKKRT